MLDIFYTSKFKKDYKKMVKQGKPIYELEKIIFLLQQQEVLPEKYKDHPINGELCGI